MLDSDTINQAIGQDVHGSDGSKLGTVGQVYLDDTTGNPEWATVQTGLFGTKESFVPIADATLDQRGLTVPFDKSRVKDAPRVEAENGHLDVEEEAELYRYYGMTAGDDRAEPARDEQVFDQAAVADGEQKRPAGREDAASMTRSEERLNVGTEKVETGRARLRKYVVTENQTVTVPVTREEVRMVTEPIVDGDRSAVVDGADGLSEDQSEMVLTEERVVVNKETVPVEKVSLAKESVTEHKEVTEQVAKERIETEGDIRDQGDPA